MMYFPSISAMGACEDNPAYTIMQSTGLLDKNGKEIYEGDIVAWEDYYGNHTESVEWKEYVYAPFWSPRDDGVLSIETEIIGNIYENAELL